MQYDPTFFAFLIAVLWIRILLGTTLMWIWILLFTLMRIWILLFPWRGSGSYLSLWCGSGCLIPTKGLKPWINAQIRSYSIPFGLSPANWCGSLSGSSLSLWCGSGSGLSLWSGSGSYPFSLIQIWIHNTASSGSISYPSLQLVYNNIKKNSRLKPLESTIKAQRFLDCLGFFYFYILFATLELVCFAWRWWTNISTRELRN